MKGFRLAQLIVTGTGQPDAKIDFEPGFNVLTGPSNSGKSYIVECIDYVFGAETIPGKDIDEGKGYELVFLEIITHAGTPYTLERSLAGGDVRLYESTFNDRTTASTRSLSVEAQTKKTETLSAFLLKLMDVEGARVRTNANGELGNLTFRIISHLFLVDETSIIAKKRSPVRLITGYAATTSDRAFNFLLTGKDDRTIIAVPSDKERTARLQGRKDLYDELIEGLTKRVEAIDLQSIKDQLQRADAAIGAAAAGLSEKSLTIQSHQRERTEAFERQHTAESRLIVVAELLTRFDLLKQHYASDLRRLEFLDEGEHYFDQLVAVNCPLCGVPLEGHAAHKFSPEQADTFTSVREASAAEAEKIRRHLADLEKTIQTLAAERTVNEETARKSKAEIDSIDRHLMAELKPTFEAGKQELDTLTIRRRDLAEVEADFALLERYRAARLGLDRKQPRPKTALAGLDMVATRELCDVIQDMLRSWNFIDSRGVVEFDEKAMDIRVAGKPRQSNGKGLRGFLHSAFNLGLMEYCRGKGIPHAGFLLLDSPITSYREGKTNEAEDEATLEVQTAFWDHLADTSSEEQVIIIENKEPTEKARSQAHYVRFFGKKSTEGRQGFFPIEQEQLA